MAMGLFSELLGTPQAQDHDGIFSTSSKYYAHRPASERAASAAERTVPAVPERVPLPETKKPLSRKRKHTLQDAAPAPAPPSQSDLDSLQTTGTIKKARGKTKNKPRAQAKQTAAAAQLSTPASGKSAKDPTVQGTATELTSNKRQKRRQALAATASRPAGTIQQGDSSDDTEEPEGGGASGTSGADRAHRTIFVGNLPAGTSRRAVKNIFSRYGLVEKVYLRSLAVDPGVKVPKRVAIITGQTQAGAASNAYVVFTDDSAAKASLAHNMQLEGGRHLRVDSAAQQPQYDATRSVFVGNLPFVVDTEDLLQHLEAHCAAQPGLPAVPTHVTALRVVRDPATKSSKGFAFAELGSKAAMYAALKANSTTFQKRELRVTRLKPPSAQKGARPGLKSSGQNRPTSKAQGAQRRMQQGIVPSRESWQGTRTKGPSKVVQPRKVSGSRPKATAPAKGTPKQPAKGATPARTGGKRPAVAARKAKRTKS